MNVETFHDPATQTLTYVAFDPKTRDAVIIDPVLDFDPKSGNTSTEALDKVVAFARGNELTVHYVLETHAHADHLSGAQLLTRKLGGKVAIGEKIRLVQKTFRAVFDLPADFAVDGSQFDRLLEDGETLTAGSLEVQTLATPGHTPACMSYRIDDAVFSGDALFLEDYGTGRCDFPLGSADDLYTSVHDKLYALPDDTRVFVGHDYQPGGREVRWETTIAASKKSNPQLRAETPREDFVRMRTERDATLAAPRLLYPSVQVNIDAGRLPPAHDNGTRYLRIPVNRATPTDDAGARVA
jgi:glyoxylase-like metal-dependent hydrolase (beta-lactamase superfamily II)